MEHCANESFNGKLAPRQREMAAINAAGNIKNVISVCGNCANAAAPGRLKRLLIASFGDVIYNFPRVCIDTRQNYGVPICATQITDVKRALD